MDLHPVINRPTRSGGKVLHAACIIPPIMKIQALIMIAFFRPITSVLGPAYEYQLTLHCYCIAFEIVFTSLQEY
jgi:hypothetical protein